MSKLPVIEELLSNLLSEVQDISAALIVDFNGFIMAKKSVKEFDDDLIGGIMTLLDQTLNRIKRYTQTELASGSFVMDDFHLFYIELGKNTNAIFVLIGNPYSNLDKYLPYSHIIANQVSLILNNHDPCCIVPKMNQNDELILKQNCRNIIIVGSEAVGKTALIGMFKNNSFIETYNPTIGISILEKEILIDNDIGVILNLFDLSGLKSFGKVRSHYYRYAHAVLILFDYSNLETLRTINKWIEEAQQFVSNKEIPFIIIGNKIDIVSNRKEAKEKALELAINNNFAFFETSVVANEGINELFNHLITNNFLDYKDRVKSRPLSSIRVEVLSQDEKIVFICKIDCESIEGINIPNVIEKTILMNVAKFKEISLAVLLEKLDSIGKALNRNIDRETVLKIAQKYIQQGHIEKLYLKTKKDLEKLNILNIVKQKNVL